MTLFSGALDCSRADFIMRHDELDAPQGLGGSVLESKLTNVTQPHLACSGDHDWQVIAVTAQRYK